MALRVGSGNLHRESELTRGASMARRLRQVRTPAGPPESIQKGGLSSR